MGATPYEAIDILVTKLMDLDATDAVILGRDIEQALTTVTAMAGCAARSSGGEEVQHADA